MARVVQLQQGLGRARPRPGSVRPSLPHVMLRHLVSSPSLSTGLGLHLTSVFDQPDPQLIYTLSLRCRSDSSPRTLRASVWWTHL